MSIYTQNILEHFKSPQNKGIILGAQIDEENVNRSCWDRVRVYAELKGEMISDIKFEWDWCAISMASCSMLTDEIKWMKTAEVMKLKLEDVEDMLWVKVWANRIKCAMLCLETLQHWISSHLNS